MARRSLTVQLLERMTELQPQVDELHHHVVELDMRLAQFEKYKRKIPHRRTYDMWLRIRTRAVHGMKVKDICEVLHISYGTYTAYRLMTNEEANNLPTDKELRMEYRKRRVFS